MFQGKRTPTLQLHSGSEALDGADCVFLTLYSVIFWCNIRRSCRRGTVLAGQVGQMQRLPFTLLLIKKNQKLPHRSPTLIRASLLLCNLLSNEAQAAKSAAD